METPIETIRVAVQSDATEEAKHPCWTILSALKAKQGEPLVPPTKVTTGRVGTPPESSWPIPLASRRRRFRYWPGLAFCPVRAEVQRTESSQRAS